MLPTREACFLKWEASFFTGEAPGAWARPFPPFLPVALVTSALHVCEQAGKQTLCSQV